MEWPALAELQPDRMPPGRNRLRCAIAWTDNGPVGCNVVVVRGSDGPALLAVGAVHGDEYEGPAALDRLGDELDPATLRGTVVLIPVLNEPAFYAGDRCGPDGLNLARVFPGRRDGAVTEQIAAALAALLARIDAFVDLHAAGSAYTLKPWAGYGLHVDPAVLDTQRRMAVAFGLDFVWGTPLQPGRTLSTAAELGVPAIYVEQTGAGLCRPADVEANLRGLRGVLACMDMLDCPYSTGPRWFRETGEGQEGHLQVDHPAPRQGVFEPWVRVWEAVSEGQPLGRIRTPGADDAVTVYAQRSGRVAVLRSRPPVDADEFLAVVVPV